MTSSGSQMPPARVDFSLAVSHSPIQAAAGGSFSNPLQEPASQPGGVGLGKRKEGGVISFQRGLGSGGCSLLPPSSRAGSYLPPASFLPLLTPTVGPQLPTFNTWCVPGCRLLDRRESGGRDLPLLPQAVCTLTFCSVPWLYKLMRNKPVLCASLTCQDWCFLGCWLVAR